jgi:hypothetical protein
MTKGDEMPDLDPQEVAKLRKRVEQLEAQMEFLHRRLGISQAGEAPKGEAPANELPKWKPSQMVVDLVRKGDKSSAIRIFMKETGASLKDAITYINSL